MPTNEDSTATGELQWYACHTRARHEKQVATALRQRGFESYLPTFPRTSQWKDRKKVVAWPLFPGYVFVAFGSADVGRILATPGVATIVRVNGRPAPIRADEMENVRLFAAALQHATTEPVLRPFFAVGSGVLIRTGAFAGVRGVVLQRRNRRRVLVGVEAIGRGLEIDIEDGLLEPIDGSTGSGEVPSPG
jgi:transcription antitermination factor NusG